MKSGVCPKCKSAEVREGSGVPWKKGAGVQYALKISAASAAALDHYVCIDCGYVEAYVCERADLQAIAQKWLRVTSGPDA